MAYKQHEIDYTKGLYLELDEKGKQVNPWKEIVDLVNKKVSDDSGKVSKYSEKMLGEWVNKYGWADELKTIKETFAKKVEADRIKQDTKNEKQAEKDRNDLLNRGASTLELGRAQNKKAFDALHQVMEAKIYFTSLYHAGKTGDDKKQFTQEQIEERMLTAQQETALYKTLAERSMKYDEIIAEAVQTQDNELEVTINVIDKTKDKSDGVTRTTEGQTF